MKKKLTKKSGNEETRLPRGQGFQKKSKKVMMVWTE